LQRFSLNSRSTFLVTQSEAFAAELAFRQGRVSEALNWARQFDPEPFTPIYYFYSPLMTFAKVLVLSDCDESHERARVSLNNLIDYLTRIHNRRFLIEAVAIRAMLLAKTGDDEASTDELAKAVSMAQSSRFIRLFVDLGPRIAILLNRLRLDGESRAYVAEILAAFRTSNIEATISGPDYGVDPLSDRELQVLAMLAERHSNKEIASGLQISIVTVKRHASNIYQKLGVHSRRQAVAKAVSLGMFSRSE